MTVSSIQMDGPAGEHIDTILNLLPRKRVYAGPLYDGINALSEFQTQILICFPNKI